LRRFASMYTLQGETRPTWHVRFPRQSTYALRTLPVGGPRMWQPFARHRQIWTDPTAPEKKGSWHNPQHAGWPIRGSVPSFSPEPANKVGGVSQAPDDDQLLGLPGPYHRHAIGMFNTYSRGGNQTVLNRHRWRLQPRRCWLATCPLLNLPNQLSPLSPSGPARSPF
jgi:hypothetical protein